MFGFIIYFSKPELFINPFNFAILEKPVESDSSEED